MKLYYAKIYFDDSVVDAVVPDKTLEKVDVLKKSPYFHFGRISPESIFTIFTNIAFLLESGISYSEAFKLLYQKTKNPFWKGFFFASYVEIINSSSPTSIMPDYGIKGIPPIIVASGEKSGHLAESYKLSAVFVEKVSKVRKSLFGKLSYPVGLFVASVVLLIFVSYFALPELKHTGFFKLVPANMKNNVLILEKVSKITPMFFGLVITAGFLSTVLFFFSEKAQEILSKVKFFKYLFIYPDVYVGFTGILFQLKSGLTTSYAFEKVVDVVSLPYTKKRFLSASEKIKRNQNFEEDMDFLSDVERVVLANSLKENILVKNIEVISNRIMEIHRKYVESFASNMYRLAVFIALYSIFVVVYSVFLPYYSVLGNLLGGAR